MKRNLICLLIAVLPAFLVAAELKTDIPFVNRDGKDLKLDIVTQDDGKLHPAIVCIHGGGWRSGSRQAYHPLLKSLAAKGYVAATVEYRLTDVASWPAQMDDVNAAHEFLIKNAKKYGIDAERVGVMGHSAGGHLSLMLGTQPTERKESLRIRAVANYFGPTDMREPKKLEHVRDVVEALVSGRMEAKLDVLEILSPIVHVDRTDAPVITFHGTEDEIVQVEHAHVLHAALKKHQIPNHMEILNGAGHGVGEHRSATDKLRDDFFDSYLKCSELPFVTREDFDEGASRWQPTDADAWKAVEKEGRSFYSLIKKVSNYQPPVRSPHNIALLNDIELSDFTFEVDLRSTNEPYGHQSLCLFFGYQDPSHFYYVHFGRNADAHANSVFLVNGSPRVSIATERTMGTDWSAGWHRARIQRDTSSGSIEVYFDDMQKPVMKAVDKTFGVGRVGIGSFDDKGDFDAVRIWGKQAEKK